MRVKENLLTESIPFHKKDLWLHVVSVEYLDNYQLKLTFNNGIEGIVDLEQELYGADFAPEFLFEIALDKQPVSKSDL
jgi:hypothetical protein